MTPAALRDLRAALLKELSDLAASAPAAARARAKQLSVDRSRSATARAVAQLARVQLGLYKDPADGRAAVKAGLAGLGAYSRANRAGAPLLRDACVVGGLFHARHRRAADARRLYLRALDGERDATRRALVHLNLAKLHLARGELYDAVDWARRVKPEAVAREDVRDALALVRARVFLTLGFNGAAERIVRAVRLRDLAPFPNRLEHRYLGLAARVRQPFDAAGFERRLDDFAAWAAEAAPTPAAKAFYELEVWLLRRALGSPRIHNRRHAAERVQYLAKAAGAVDFRALYRALDDLLARGPEGGRLAACEDALAATEAAASHLTYQLVVLLAARQLLAARHRPAARRLLSRLRLHWKRLESGFPASALARMRATDDAPRSLAAALDEGVEAEAAAAEAWLFEPSP